MNVYIALLRGINVSGKNILKMAELTKMFIASGFRDIKTYIQSGNIVFSYESIPTGDIEKRVKDLILTNFGLDIPVLVLSMNEVRRAIENNPFLNNECFDILHLHVTFLSDVPDQDKIKGLKNGNYGQDEFLHLEKLIFLHCPNGYGNTQLTNTMLESKLKVTATTRNWKTVNELLKMAENLVNT